MSDPLWSDKRIHDEVTLRVREQKSWAAAIAVAKAVRDDLDIQLHDAYLAGTAAGRAKERARITELEQEQIALWHTINTQATYAEELEAQLAERWEPLPRSLEYDLITMAIHGGEIPMEYRLCRLVTQEPTLQPDWSKAPEWANWWAVNDDGGFGIWYEAEPKPRIAIPIWQEPEGTRAQNSGNVVLPFGIEWRNTLRQRPQEPTPQPAIPPDVRERLADYAHEAWSGWMRYMFTIGTLLNDKWMSPEPGQQAKLLLPEWAVERWRRQMNTPYAELPESEKASDRDEADAILTIIRAWLDAQEPTP